MKKLLITVLLAALLVPGAALAVSLHSDWYQDKAIYFYDTYPMRWVDAIGTDVIKYTQDFASLDSDTPGLIPTEWTEFPVGASTARINTAAGGELIITTGVNNLDSVNLQVKGQAFYLEDTMPLYFGIRIKIDEATDAELYIGISVTDTDLTGGVTDAIFFQKLDTETGVTAVTTDGAATETDDCAVMDTDYHIYEFVCDGNFTTAYTSGTVKFYIDGVLVATHTTTANISTDTTMTPTIEFTSGTGAVTATVDWIRVIQLR